LFTLHRQSALRLKRPACFALASAFTVMLSLAAITNANMKVTMQTISYKGWAHNLQLSNGTVELVMTLDVGPRIIRYAYVGEPNVFKEYDEQMGKSGEKEWMIRGGHRLWHAPEEETRTYVLDNSPIKHERLNDASVRLIQPVEKLTGIQKEMDVTLSPEGTNVKIIHRLRNTGAREVELAPWALSVMAPGGTAIIPLPEKISHPGSLQPGETKDLRGFAPNQTLIVWPFTDLSDPRWRFGAQYITLKQDRAATKPTKLGLAHKTGWIGYLNSGTLFVKGFTYEAGKTYTDGGSNFETFTNKEMLEVESLGPLQRIAPGKAIEHVEDWWLLKGLPAETTDAALDANIRPRVAALMK
jgi:hypothetical protein